MSWRITPDQMTNAQVREYGIRASARITELEAEASNAELRKDSLLTEIAERQARIAELESFQINFQHATDIDREDYKQRVAELEAERDALKAELSLAQGAGHAPPQAKP